MRKFCLIVAKVIFPLAIVGWLLWNIPPQEMKVLRSTDKNWWLLAAGFVLSLAALINTFSRWHILVRCLGLPFRFTDALRLGFLGFLLNFVSAGTVGGDLFRAVFVAREQPSRRPEAVASVFIDRLIGLYALFVVTCLATAALDWHTITPAVRNISALTYWVTGTMTLGVIALSFSATTHGALAVWARRLPKVGATIGRLFDAVGVYRQRRVVVLWAFFQSVVTHLLSAGSFYCLANGLFAQTPSAMEHLIIVPLSMVAGAMPFTPAGLGVFELAMDKLYQFVPASGTPIPGVVVALAFRLVQVAMASLGVIQIWSSRADLERIKEEAEAIQAKKDAPSVAAEEGVID